MEGYRSLLERIDNTTSFSEFASLINERDTDSIFSIFLDSAVRSKNPYIIAQRLYGLGDLQGAKREASNIQYLPSRIEMLFSLGYADEASKVAQQIKNPYFSINRLLRVGDIDSAREALEKRGKHNSRHGLKGLHRQKDLVNQVGFSYSRYRNLYLLEELGVGIEDRSGVIEAANKILDPFFKYEKLYELGDLSGARMAALEIKDPLSRYEKLYKIGDRDGAMRAAREVTDIDLLLNQHLRLDNVKGFICLLCSLDNPLEKFPSVVISYNKYVDRHSYIKDIL